ncbi:MAG: putative membrane protein [Paraglaciecola sp.]|jgi:uncharacterized membrane protein
MPEISLFGWFHTGIAILALFSGFYTLAKFKVISLGQLTGKIYIVCTLIAAITALFIYRHDGFGAAHALAVLTLLAIAVGMLSEKFRVVGKLSPYLQAMSYSATFLFHMIPAITDGLMRLPTDAPIVTDIENPLLKQFYLGFLITFVIGFILQVIWLRNRSNNS